MRILYDSKSSVFKTPFGTVKQNEPCSISIHIPKSCLTVSCKLIFNSENGEEFIKFNMEKNGEYDGYEVYSCRFSIDCAGLYFYYFRITTQNEEFSLYKYGYDMTNIEDGELWQLSCIPSSFTVPKRFFGNIMYQIFPDRFFKSGECQLDGKLQPYSIHSDFSELPCFAPNKNGEVLNCDFFGGNFNGIAEKLPYLAQMSVSVIYLNPIFKAYSNHRYDTADYKKPDEMLGTEEDFRKLCEKAHSLNIKIILDGVFSHTGANSVYFDRNGIFGNGAVSNENSPYRSWYDFEHYPDKYVSWWGIDTLPCVNELSDGYTDFIIDSKDSVIAHWLNAGADGFRLDVADELPDEFIAKLRNRLKKINPDALLIGEVWEDASNKISYGKRREYFSAGELDSVMNYPFRKAIIELLNGIDDGSGFRETVMSIAENYPKESLNVLMNFLSTHDTARIISVLGPTPPEQKDARAVFRMNEYEYAEAFTKLKAAVFLQFMLPGMPCIYYGDEIGMQGYEDPFCRAFFEWEKVNQNAVRAYYIRLTKIRCESEELKSGDIDISIESGVITIKRQSGKLIAYLRFSDNYVPPKISGNIIFTESANSNGDELTMEKYGCAIVNEKTLQK